VREETAQFLTSLKISRNSISPNTFHPKEILVPSLGTFSSYFQLLAVFVFCRLTGTADADKDALLIRNHLTQPIQFWFSDDVRTIPFLSYQK
jgi:hypothetical protein